MLHEPNGRLFLWNTQSGLSKSSINASALLKDSTTIRAISNTMIKLGVNDTGTIDAEAVEELVQSLLNMRIGSRFKHLDRYRVQVFLGGLAILHAIFELLDVRDLKPARGAIREGVLLEMHQQALTTAKAA